MILTAFSKFHIINLFLVNRRIFFDFDNDFIRFLRVQRFQQLIFIILNFLSLCLFCKLVALSFLSLSYSLVPSRTWLNIFPILLFTLLFINILYLKTFFMNISYSHYVSIWPTVKRESNLLLLDQLPILNLSLSICV
jgi:hypothetical protein